MDYSPNPFSYSNRNYASFESLILGILEFLAVGQRAGCRLFYFVYCLFDGCYPLSICLECEGLTQFTDGSDSQFVWCVDVNIKQPNSQSPQLPVK